MSAVAAGSDTGLGVYPAAAHALWHPHKAAQTLGLLPRAAHAAQSLRGSAIERARARCQLQTLADCFPAKEWRHARHAGWTSAFGIVCLAIHCTHHDTYSVFATAVKSMQDVCTAWVYTEASERGRSICEASGVAGVLRDLPEPAAKAAMRTFCCTGALQRPCAILTRVL